MNQPRYELVLDEPQIRDLIADISREIVTNDNLGELAIIGIKTRGEILARRIKRQIEEANGSDIPLGALDITLYRDDLHRAATQPTVKGTEIDFALDGKRIVLVDDVLYTGRTVRAAIDQIMDFGRPKRVELAVIVDRGHRELPIAANYVGKVTATSPDDVVKVRIKEIDGADEVVILRGLDAAEA